MPRKPLRKFRWRRFTKREKNEVKKTIECLQEHRKMLNKKKETKRLDEGHKRYIQKRGYNLSLKEVKKTRKQLKLKGNQFATITKEERSLQKEWEEQMWKGNERFISPKNPKNTRKLKEEKRIMEGHKRFLQKEGYNSSLKHVNKTRKQLKLKGDQFATITKEEKKAYKEWGKQLHNNDC